MNLQMEIKLLFLIFIHSKTKPNKPHFNKFTIYYNTFILDTI